MSKEKELLKRSVRIIESLGPDYEAYNLIDKIEELLAQPEKTEQEPIFQKAYYDDEINDLMVDFYDKLNADDCGIPVDKNGFCEGVFEVSINWRKQ